MMVTLKQWMYLCRSSYCNHEGKPCPQLWTDFGLFLIGGLSLSCTLYPATQILLLSLYDFGSQIMIHGAVYALSEIHHGSLWPRVRVHPQNILSQQIENISLQGPQRNTRPESMSLPQPALSSLSSDVPVLCDASEASTMVSLFLPPAVFTGYLSLEFLTFLIRQLDIEHHESLCSHQM